MLLVVESRDHRHTDDHLHSKPRRQTGIAENNLAIFADNRSVRLGVDLLDIEQNQVGPGQHPLDRFRLSQTRGLHRRMQSQVSRPFEQRQREFGLREWLAARNRHSPAGVFVEHAIPLHLCQHICCSRAASHKAHGTRGAYLGAFIACVALDAIDRHCIRLQAQRLCVACGDAAAAQQAAGPRVEQLGQSALRLRVAAPRTVSRTTLEEHGRPNPGAVVDAEPLHIENAAKYRRKIHLPSCRAQSAE